MNTVMLMGRLTKDPDVTYTQGSKPMCIARYTLAVDKRRKAGEAPSADFIRISTFGKNAEFAEKYLRKGVKIAITGHINTGSYEKDGQRIYTTEIIADSHEFCESKNAIQADAAAPSASTESTGSLDDFMKIADGMEEDLPFS